MNSDNYPQAIDYYKKNNWGFLPSIDRVYSIEKAKKELNYKPLKNFDSLINT
ncbi:hypothetical protein [Tenacibaculum aiptasiae]|uniref:hypothetical protein n=1 Tax=Tenacibaculum aiptasiae TaxID=426481 RepID=UPI00232F259B|nr:hypothetical protein [Tenacibaculum aiptasiae]